MRVRNLPVAEREIQRVVSWYEGERPGLGFEFLAELASYYRLIEENPASFPKTETYSPRTREIRRAVLSRFSYVIYYEVRPDEILVLAVSHSSRRPNYWRRRKE
ncbi:MAG: type II toxin-antitoxin system RelE/ParE family toxin [Gemmataceae bacterium]